MRTASSMKLPGKLKCVENSENFKMLSIGECHNSC
jgi:hypothetical protein